MVVAEVCYFTHIRPSLFITIWFKSKLLLLHIFAKSSYFWEWDIPWRQGVAVNMLIQNKNISIMISIATHQGDWVKKNDGYSQDWWKHPSSCRPSVSTLWYWYLTPWAHNVSTRTWQQSVWGNCECFGGSSTESQSGNFQSVHRNHQTCPQVLCAGMAQMPTKRWQPSKVSPTKV